MTHAVVRGLADRVEGEFQRHPGLTLSVCQLADWLEIEDDISCRVLESLVDAGAIERSYDGLYRLLILH